jgi:hypothetical protein
MLVGKFEAPNRVTILDPCRKGDQARTATLIPVKRPNGKDALEIKFDDSPPGKSVNLINAAVRVTSTKASQTGGM